MKRLALFAAVIVAGIVYCLIQMVYCFIQLVRYIIEPGL